MCKRHWKQVHFPPPATKTEDQPPPPEGDSVWDTILPASISYRPTSGKAKLKFEKESVDGDPPPPPDGVAVMPLVAHLREGEAREARLGKSIAKQSEGRVGEKYLPVGGWVRKRREVGDQFRQPLFQREHASSEGALTTD